MNAERKQGLYIHVPFCKSRCAYCSFYSTLRHDLVEGYLLALEREMSYAAGYIQPEADTCKPPLSHTQVSTIYIGGGTPSQLGEANLSRLFESIRQHFDILPDAEITVEVNPDDVTPDLVRTLARCGVNRASMGVQSFLDEELKLINRRHTAQQAREAVRLIHEAGITNLSIDLIYGLPYQTLETFGQSIEAALALPVSHISSYALSIEEGTALWRLRNEGKFQETDEELMLAMYELLRERLLASGYQHYEISNFALPGYASRHNSSYWQGAPYIGLGPGAHGYDGYRTRYHSADDLAAYVREPAPKRFIEDLNDDELYDELVFTRLRQAAGLMLEEVPEARRPYLLKMASPHLKAGRLELHEGSTLRLTPKGLFVSDDVMSDLMAE